MNQTILLPPLYIKLGIIKNFVKAMDRKGSGFDLLQDKFPCIRLEKLKASIFDGPQIRKPMKNPLFDEALNETVLSTWQSLKSEITKFLGNHRSVQYERETTTEEFPPILATNLS